MNHEASNQMIQLHYTPSDIVHFTLAIQTDDGNCLAVMIDSISMEPAPHYYGRIGKFTKSLKLSEISFHSSVIIYFLK